MRRRWDIFCTVIDNFGDIGVCWRLSRQLAHEYGQLIRLWVDDLHRFSCLESTINTELQYQTIQNIEVWHWQKDTKAFEQIEPAEVVIEAFACELPEDYLQKMFLRDIQVVWINLEYLSAEPWVRNYHAVSSPHPRSGLIKTCFFPGFEPDTGGLIREKGYKLQQDNCSKQTILQELENPFDRYHAIRISLFCYDSAPVENLIILLSELAMPILLIVPQGNVAQHIIALLGYPRNETKMQFQQVMVLIIPFLEQTDYDRLLWSCDINFVRGEDSFVRAQYVARPFVWNIYQQEELIHWQKLDAFLDLYTASMPMQIKDVVREIWYCWNGRGLMTRNTLLKFFSLAESIEQYNKMWLAQLEKQNDLASNLVQFVENRL
ncbi:conserved hypothetical protein, PP_1857 family [Nitrosomonas sp. PY1]|uniref:elongation factor P maturation arginine rhamnosyltransferase EarP n=1 Tax=Nitrosomonas sp. PY1 TaxID=1803906 RepID=UPI001FC88F19|nr:elongation factor P maturation arginine rhamnosyltransferase EarP [Nitrosomonas sp. PY1]GKS68654.1 conserved hypothetical protein, PP_1857 family [Nitrosomonas sp. PY1]